MSERWPRFGFKQPATDPEAGTVASTDGADPDADVKAPAVAAMEPAPTHAETPGEATEQALVAEAAASTGAPGPDEATAQARLLKRFAPQRRRLPRRPPRKRRSSNFF